MNGSTGEAPGVDLLSRVELDGEGVAADEGINVGALGGEHEIANCVLGLGRVRIRVRVRGRVRFRVMVREGRQVRTSR